MDLINYVAKLLQVQVFLVTIDLPASSQITASPGRKNAEEQHKDDACPDIHRGPDTVFKLTTVITNDDIFACCTANRGYKISRWCRPGYPKTTEYTNCEAGTYIDEYAHNRTNCVEQIKECPPGQILIEGTTSIASRCDCQGGYYMTSEERCKPHSSCLSGEGVDSLGSPDHDTICKKCLYGYHSPSHSPTERCTQISEQIIETTLVQTTAVINNNKRAETEATPPVNSVPNAKDVSIAVLATAVVSLAFFCGFIIYRDCCKKKRQNAA